MRKEMALTHLSEERRPPLRFFLKLLDQPGAQHEGRVGGTWPKLEG